MITTTLHVNFHLNVGYNLPWAQVPVLYFRPQIIKDRYIHIYIYIYAHTHPHTRVIHIYRLLHSSFNIASYITQRSLYIHRRQTSRFTGILHKLEKGIFSIRYFIPIYSMAIRTIESLFSLRQKLFLEAKPGGIVVVGGEQ